MRCRPDLGHGLLSLLCASAARVHLECCSCSSQPERISESAFARTRAASATRWCWVGKREALQARRFESVVCRPHPTLLDVFAGLFFCLLQA